MFKNIYIIQTKNNPLSTEKVLILKQVCREEFCAESCTQTLWRWIRWESYFYQLIFNNILFAPWIISKSCNSSLFQSPVSSWASHCNASITATLPIDTSLPLSGTTLEMMIVDFAHVSAKKKKIPVCNH